MCRTPAITLLLVTLEAGVSAKAYPADGKNHRTINSEIGLPDDKSTKAVFEFVKESLSKAPPR